MTNASYISTPGDDLAELWVFLDPSHVQALLVDSDGQFQDPVASPSQVPTATQLSRLYYWFNWSKEVIDGYFRDQHDLTGITAANAPLIFKQWSARLTLNQLEWRRHRKIEECTESINSIHKEMIGYATYKNLQEVNIPRLQRVGAVELPRGSSFDAGGQFADVESIDRMFDANA